jgi:hypothetical protein
MQRPIEYNQGFMKFDLPKYELMTPDKFEKYVKQSFNLEPQSEAEAEPQVQYQTQPQTQPQTHFPRDLFGQIKPATQLSQPTQLTNFTNPTQPIRSPCMGATGPTQPNISFGDALTNLKKEKAKNEIIESLYTELSSIRSQIELLTKTTDNIYRIINKL